MAKRRTPKYQREEERQQRDAAADARAKKLAAGTAVDPNALRPDGSYGQPAFVARGLYVDQPFECVDCGQAEVWTATQQKWWYEVAKGGVWTTARRCRNCRRRERDRRNEARRVHQEGLARKQEGRS